MSRKTNKGGGQRLVPKLRFPEFRDAGEWNEKPLSTLGQTISGLAGKSGEDFGEGQPFVTYKQVFDCAWIDFSKCGRVKIADNEKQNTLQRGDVLFTTSSETPEEVGYASVLLYSLSAPVYLNSFCFAFRPNCLHTLMPEFSCYLFHSPIYRTLINVLAQGITRFNISKSAFLKLSLPIPKEGEQQKIAECLSSLDELITLEAQKLDAFKTHKKGLMQQMFPAAGEALPKLRFPEFWDAGAWEEKKAGALFANRIEDGEEGLPIYSVTMNDGMVKRLSLERSVNDIAESSGNKKAYNGDIAYNMMRMWQGAFGVSKEDCMVSPAYVVLSLGCDAYPYFFGYLFKLPKYLQLLTSHSQGLTLDRLRLYYKDFARILVLIPSLSEQQRIADCLASLDDLITAQAQKLVALKIHKKGLMQQLFPAFEEGNA